MSTWRDDALGGLTAAVVALPLALAFGVASGVGAAAGLYGAIVVGFFAAMFGGTRRQISGPTGPMTVVMAATVASLQAQFGEAGVSMAFVAVVLAGLLQIAFGVAKLGKYFIMVPYTVISGFMSGIGVIIIIIQLPTALGVAGEPEIHWVLGHLGLLANNWHWPTVLVFSITMAVMWLWPTAIRRYCPASLAALLIGTLVVVSCPQWFASLTTIGFIPQQLPSVQWHWPAWSAWSAVLYAAALLAVLGSIDSLLTSLVADNLSKENHDSDQELIGQGIGNALAGLVMGLPGAGATMRTVVNIRAGGKTGGSGIAHSVTLMLVLLGAAPLAAQIPMVVLAAILIKVGVDIIDWPFLAKIPRLPIGSVALMSLVLVLTVWVDLITAVLVGVFIANLITLERLSHIQLDGVRLFNHWLSPQGELLGQGAVLTLSLHGPLSFAVGRGLKQRLTHFNQHAHLLIDLTHAQLVGTSTSLMIDEVVAAELAVGRQVWILGANDKTRDLLLRLGSCTKLDAERWLQTPEQATAVLHTVLTAQTA